MANFFLFLAISSALVVTTFAQSFSSRNFGVTGNAYIQEGGNQLQLNLEPAGGSEAVSTQQYLYGRFDMQIKAVAGYSAGVVTSYFLQSPRPANDQMDFELLGNVTGQPYILHTNVWTSGQGNREQQIFLWFDPTADFHTYTFVWNPQNILWLVDGIPVRVYRNAQQQGIPYLNSQPLSVHNAVWNGEQWATRRGQVRIDWSRAPFVGYYRSYSANACVASSSQDASNCSGNSGEWMNWSLDEAQASRLRWVRENYLVYDYCQDQGRFPQGTPPECSVNNV
ncbi:putative xyloglucan endotransglucosylase/hydrolase protein 13 [Asparagus officinalis]|uniref:putative xyloglucan endotransglucosylase/hydrolase protein 13 n=1 Tax=Asparagus officinalis TaxID=4686 RepID=UPI00098E1C14|nr:putative xyloglucan endotransglucosylase/hydrolase protein 13 [Asparagus officinalis]